MQILLDTHALLWWLAGDGRLSPLAREHIGDESNEIFVSAASAWEVATKARLGKLPGAEFLAAEFSDHVAAQGFSELPISILHAQLAGSLPGPHRDPFDRMLAAQARAGDLLVISIDAVFDRFGVRRVW